MKESIGTKSGDLERPVDEDAYLISLLCCCVVELLPHRSAP